MTHRPTAGFWRQAAIVAMKDLRTEGRAGEVLFVAIPFGAAALFLAPLAVGADLPLLRRIGPGLFWLVFLLFGSLVALRQTAVDEPPQRDLLRLLGVDPAAAFAGRALASAVLLGALALVLAPLTVVLFDARVPGSLGWLALVVGLAALGLALLGTVAGAITADVRGRSTLAPLLVAPLAVPLLVAAARATEGLSGDGGILPWVALMGVVDLSLALAGSLVARPLEEG